MSTQDPREFRLKSRRFEIVRVLGQGGMGVVYEARDRERDATVALKMLRSIRAQAKHRLKQEFRALQGIHHPNLVSLGELLEEDGELFFTMELVAGQDFIEHVRPSASPRVARETRETRLAATDLETRVAGAEVDAEVAEREPSSFQWLERRGAGFDEERLRAALLKLAHGIEALHAADKIHRDIKPSNVLVTASGRVVILDFGLVLDAARGELEGAVVGTAHFMAPEQAAGDPVGPEADWYSVGAMLYLALTGFYPFQLAPEVALDFKQAVEPTRPSVVAGEPIPLDLEELCVDLLRRDPSARPLGAEVRRRLEEGRISNDPAPTSSRSSGFVGRVGELAQLRDALAVARAGAAMSILVEGESGMGKSALVRRFLASIEGDAAVLAGRCYARESVPYKGVDEIGEALGRWLAALPAERVTALLPPDAELLGDLFPALRLSTPRGRSSRPSAPISSNSAARDAADPRRVRALVFAALRELLARIAREQPLVVVIDDLQWADADGLALLDAILRPPDAPPLLFIATLRRDLDARGDAAPLLPGPLATITIGRLPPGEARELTSLLLGAAAVAGSPEVVDVDALAEEGGGHPLFLDALVRHRLSQSGDVGLVRLDDVLRARIERLDLPARRLIDVIAIAGRPIPARIAAQAAEVHGGDLSPALAALRAENLATTAGIGPGETVEPFHDRVREAVLGAIATPRRRAIHLQLALGLEAWGGADLEALTLHFRDAGDVERSSEYAARAGDQAAAALAFDRAAELYRAAHALFPRDRAERRDLLIKLGDALSNAGRGAQAAEAYLGASRAAEADLGIDLRRRAADNLIRAGHIDEGVACLAAVMDAVGLGVAATPARALASLIFRRAQLGLRGISFRERAASEISARELTRVDVSYSAASSVSLVDVTRGVAWQSRHLLLALDAGEPARVARALALEACLVACEGPAAAARAAEVLAAATAAAARAGDPHSLGLIEGTVGMSHFFAGRFRPALAALDRAESIFRDRGGVVWERALAVVHAVWALWLLGDAGEIQRRIPVLAREAAARGDRYVALYLRANVGNASWLFADQPDEAERQIDLACAGWTGTTFDVHGLSDLVARASLALYRGDGASAQRRIVEGKAVFARTSSTRIQIVQISLQHLAGRAALAAAPKGRDGAALLADAASAAARIERERAPWGAPLADLLRAGVAAARGDRASAITTLDRAVRAFHAADMALYDAAARRRLGELIGGDDGAAMTRKATTWMEAQGIVSPARLTALLAPGFTA